MTWTVLAECATGTSHRARNTPCQDACRIGALGPTGDWLIVVVADGAGSAKHSEVGAKLACDELNRRIESLERDSIFTRDGMIALFADVRSALVLEAERNEVSARELACTLLFALVGPDSGVFAQIGDGAIVVRQTDDYRTVFWPEPSEYANVTDFLTDERFADCMRFETITGPIHELAAFTDGLQRLALDFTIRAPLPAFFRPLFNELRNSTETGALVEPFRNFLDSSRINERTDDDKTLVLAVRKQ